MSSTATGGRSTSAMAGVRLEGITKRFGDVVALRDVSLTVEDGEFFCVLGPPGAGKTTLLRTIMGLTRPDAGSIVMGDRDVTFVEPGERDASIVFQNLALYPDKSVYDNLAFPLRQRRPKPPRQEIDEAVRSAAAILRIEPLLKRKPGQLSGGERQRVAIGRSLARAPQVYLLDEPLSALDAVLRMEMRSELKRLQHSLGRTLVYVTHDQLEAMSMANRVCVLDSGTIQQVGPPLEIYERPANAFVARTLGSPPMNQIRASIARENGAVRIDAGPLQLVAAVDGATESLLAAVGQEVTIGVRAEDVLLEQRAGAAPASVITVEHLGIEAIVDLELRGQIIKASTSPTIDAAAGSTLPLSVDTSRMHVFGSDGMTIYSAVGQTHFTAAAAST